MACLRDHGIDDNNVGVGRVRRARGLSDNDGGVGRGRVIDDMSEVLETTTEAARIQVRRRRLQRRDNRPEELTTTTEALAEEDEPEDLTTTTEATTEEAEETTRLREILWRRRRRCVYRPMELMMTRGTEDSATTTDVMAGDKEYMTRPRNRRQR